MHMAWVTKTKVAMSIAVATTLVAGGAFVCVQQIRRDSPESIASVENASNEEENDLRQPKPDPLPEQQNNDELPLQRGLPFGASCALVHLFPSQ